MYNQELGRIQKKNINAKIMQYLKFKLYNKFQVVTSLRVV